MIGKILLGIIIVLLALVEVFGFHYQTLSNGTHTGVVTAVETSGIIFKTTTVYVKTDPMSSQEDEYCLIDKSLIPKLKGYEETKTQITVQYIDYWFKGLYYCNGESGGIITGVSNG